MSRQTRPEFGAVVTAGLYGRGYGTRVTMAEIIASDPRLVEDPEITQEWINHLVHTGLIGVDYGPREGFDPGSMPVPVTYWLRSKSERIEGR
jgi:hypothetical protein